MIQLQPMDLQTWQENCQDLELIWDRPLSRTLMQAATRCSLVNSESGLYFITLGDEIIGMTGFFVDHAEPLDPEEVGLRWHGVKKEFRGNGYSQAAISQVVDLVRHFHPKSTYLTEFAPTDSRAIKHFMTVGFKLGEVVENYFGEGTIAQKLRLKL